MTPSTANNELKFDVAILGAGVIGLASAHALSKKGLSVVVLERHGKFGQETSSRNSEVIHSGIYYPKESKKTEFCLKGRELLYAFCLQNRVPFRKTGKIVVATTEAETAYLEKLSQHAQSLDVPVAKLTHTQVSALEPQVKSHSALHFPETGIIDTHVLMEKLLHLAQEKGALIAYHHDVKHVAHSGPQWVLECKVGESEGCTIQATTVINAAGLNATALSNQALRTEKYQHRFCRGRYLFAKGPWMHAFQRLVYPVPDKDGLGVHVTLDLLGQCRFGPDVDWWKEPSLDKIYDCDWEAVMPGFVGAIQRYCPQIHTQSVSSGFIGVRPKLFIDQKAYPDFLLENHQGWIHLLGIESPGITSCLALAEACTDLI